MATPSLNGAAWALAGIAGLVAIALTGLAERLRNARVERADLAHVQAYARGAADEAWLEGIRWAAARGDVSPVVAQACPWLDVRPHQGRHWAAKACACAALASWATGTGDAQGATPSAVARALTCASFVALAVYDARHHEICRPLLALAVASALLGRDLGMTAGAVQAALVALPLRGGLGVMHRLWPRALGSGDLWLYACACGLVCTGEHPLRGLACLSLVSATLALLSCDPDIPTRIPAAPVVALGCLAAL
jgi:hypothetical protein